MQPKIEDGTLKRIIRNSGIILAGNSTASGINLISFAIVANQLGPEGLGILVLCQTFALVFNDLFNIETWESMIKYGSANLSKNKFNSLVLTNLSLDFISAIIATILAISLAWPVSNLLGWSNSIQDDSLIMYLSMYSLTIFFNLTSFTIGVPRLFGKYLTVSVIFTVFALLKLGCVYLALLYYDNLHAYLTTYLSFEIFTNIALIIYSLKLVNTHCGSRWWKNKIDINRTQLRFVWWTNLRTIIRIPVRRLDIVIVSAVMDLATLGLYKVYKELAGLISRIGDPVNQSIYPEFSKLIGNKKSNKSIDITKLTMALLSILGGSICIALLFGSEFIISLVFGPQYLELISALYIMYIVYTFSFITVPINSLFIAAGFAKYSFWLLLFTNAVYLISAYCLGLAFGIYGLISAHAIQMVLNKGLKVYLMNIHSSDWDSTLR